MDKESEILKSLQFAIGNKPTVHEFLSMYNKSLLGQFEDQEFIQIMTAYLAKLGLHSSQFVSTEASVVAGACQYVSIKICE